MNKLNVFNAGSSSNENGLMTAQEFVQKYMKDENFEDYAKGLRKTEVEDFKTFFECVRYGLRMADRNSQGIDRAGKPYRFYNLSELEQQQELKFFL